MFAMFHVRWCVVCMCVSICACVCVHVSVVLDTISFFIETRPETVH